MITTIFGTETEKVESCASVSGGEFAAILKDMGFTPELTNTPSGKPLVKFNILGLRSLVFFYGIENDRASSLQFCAIFKDRVSLDRLNQWNREKRYGKSYLDNDGIVTFTMDVLLEGGVLRENLTSVVRTWGMVLMSFARQLSN